MRYKNIKIYSQKKIIYTAQILSYFETGLGKFRPSIKITHTVTHEELSTCRRSLESV